MRIIAESSDDHAWNDCPHRGVNDTAIVDLDRQNHYYHDSAGCPFTCTEDHNHPSITQ